MTKQTSTPLSQAVDSQDTNVSKPDRGAQKTVRQDHQSYSDRSKTIQ